MCITDGSKVQFEEQENESVDDIMARLQSDDDFYVKDTFKVVLHRIAGGGTYIQLVASHAVTDALSVVPLLRDLEELLKQVLKGVSAPTLATEKEWAFKEGVTNLLENALLDDHTAEDRPEFKSRYTALCPLVRGRKAFYRFSPGFVSHITYVANGFSVPKDAMAVALMALTIARVLAG